MEMARRKGTFWQREKGPRCRVVVATWPDGAERREASCQETWLPCDSGVPFHLAAGSLFILPVPERG